MDYKWYKVLVEFVTGLGLGIASFLFGGWSESLTALIILMLADVIIGVIATRSGHSKKGDFTTSKLRSGLLKKLATLVLLMVGNQLDHILSVDYVVETLTYTFAMSELLSITENAENMGFNVPILSNVLEILRGKAEPKEV